MARRGGFKTQAPKQATLGISVVLWLIGLLNGLGVFQPLPNPATAVPATLTDWNLRDQVTQVRPGVSLNPRAKVGERTPCGGRNSVGRSGTTAPTAAIASSTSVRTVRRPPK